MNNEAFVVIDLEATHREPKDAHIVEWAAIVVTPPWFGLEGTPRYLGSLVRPPIAIPAETSAVHHITDADVLDAKPWELACIPLVNVLHPEGTIAVAHNANFEKELLAKHGVTAHRWLCTYKASVRVWPDAPGHSNECLRYHLGLGTGRREQQSPHSAGHDAAVTAQILGELLRAGTTIEDMLAWTEQPALLPTCPLGDWRGKKWCDVDEGFLSWILRKITDREDVVFCARTELDRRAKERADRVAARGRPADQEDEIPF
jgi:exodeoxyribonuclease X